MHGTGPHANLLDRVADFCANPPAPGPERRYAATDYLARLLPKLRTFGISRLADVTGLDRLGVPVVQAIRPRALSNAVNQGKGLALAEAAVSAAVEALETYACERLDPVLQVLHAPAEFFGQDAGALAGHLVAEPPDGWDREPIPFLQGIEPLNRRRIPVPAALVATDYTPCSGHAATPFIRTTTGLGGGATLEEAVFQGFFELLERLSTDRAMTTHGFFERCRVAIEGLADEKTAELIARVEEAGLLVAAYEAPATGPFPVAWVRLLDDRQTPTSLPYPSDGFACRATLTDALRAAFLEAVQTRAAVIAGGREDITRRFYPNRRDDALVDFERRQMRGAAASPAAVSGDPGNRTLSALAGALGAMGLEAAIVPVLAHEDVPLFIVRVVPFFRTGGADGR